MSQYDKDDPERVAPPGEAPSDHWQDSYHRQREKDEATADYEYDNMVYESSLIEDCKAVQALRTTIQPPENLKDSFLRIHEEHMAILKDEKL